MQFLRNIPLVKHPFLRSLTIQQFFKDKLFLTSMRQPHVYDLIWAIS